MIAKLNLVLTDESSCNSGCHPGCSGHCQANIEALRPTRSDMLAMLAQRARKR
jgi:hypothetical protein